MSRIKRVTRLFQSFSVVFTLTVILLLAANVAAHLIFLALRAKRPAVSTGVFFVSPMSEEGLAIRKRLFQTEDIDYLTALALGDPGIRPHTVLHFTEGEARPYYHVGVEGIRYESRWTDDLVWRWLSEPKRHTFVFGGSTTFGYGVPDDETVVAYLNRKKPHDIHLNFGVEAYDSIREVDKLIYLIRKGCRPRYVIFIDGINEVTTFAWSPFGALDKPRTIGLLLDRGEVPLIFGYPRRNNMLSALTFSFPVVQLFHWLKSHGRSESTYPHRDVNLEKIDWSELMYFYHNWDRIHVNRADGLAEELVDYYQGNISFVKQLGASLGFVPYFVYQPIGLLAKNQAFLRPEFKSSRQARIFETVNRRIRKEIAQNRLAMIDCSQAISPEHVGDSYVDSAHYSPKGNTLLAECIIRETGVTQSIE